ncbi:MAG: flippase-like domain-containing protein, partial [Clostridiales bacterium]|nr:flippase-like domain-containing protein [Clostridiales bacterium]
LKIGSSLIDVLTKMKLIRHKEEKQERLLSLIIRYHESADFMKKNKMVTVGIFMVNLIQRVAMFAVTFVIYLGFGNQGHSFLEIILLQGIVSVCADMLPLPGGVGASEKCYILVFESVFAQSLLIPSMLLYRGISFYLLVIISAITLIVIKLKDSYSVKKTKVPMLVLSTAIITLMFTGCTATNQSKTDAQSADVAVTKTETDSEDTLEEEASQYPDNAIFNSGNTANLDLLFERAMAGEELTIGFIGGSITMGSGASSQENCYANRIFEWFETSFPNAKFNYVNAGIGATDSLFGCARIDEDLLAYEPDFVIVEFSVNDSNNATYGESYESLIRKILLHNEDVALVLLYMAQFDNGTSAQGVHFSTGNYYSLPQISLFASVYQEIVAGKIKAQDLSQDMLHPNDSGHETVAMLVTNYLEKVKNGDYGSMEKVALPEPNKLLISINSMRYNNKNLEPVLNGFTMDTEKQEGITDIFKNGYFASQEGASMTFTVTGSRISLQYRKTNSCDAPTAIAIIDGDEENPVALDGNYPNGWGDWIYLHDVFRGEEGEHTVEIRLTSSGEKDFYFVSAITR